MCAVMCYLLIAKTPFIKPKNSTTNTRTISISLNTRKICYKWDLESETTVTRTSDPVSYVIRNLLLIISSRCE